MSKIVLSTKYLSKQHLIMGLLASVLVILFLAFQFTNVEMQNKETHTVQDSRSVNRDISEVDWKTVDLKSKSIPDTIKASLGSNSIKDNTLELQLANSEDGVDVKVFYKECSQDLPISNEDRKTLLLLHGAAFTSKTWEESIPTIQTMCALGYRVVAIDLPGYGKTPDCNGCNKVDFITNVFDNILGASVRPVIVSPSMSGGWSLPFIKEHQDRVRGFVPVAPVATSNFRDFFQNSMKIPTMIVFGEKDTSLGTSSYRDLKEITTSTKPQILKDASHPAYLDQPEEWHSLLHNFLSLLD